MKQRLVIVVVAVVAAAIGYNLAPIGDDSQELRLAQEVVPGATRHLALNTAAADYPALIELGYDVFDVGPSAEAIAAIPEGGAAMVWVGQFTCAGGFALPDAEFQALVDGLADDPKVYGWYLADEPNITSCPAVLDAITARATYIQDNAPDQLAFVAANTTQDLAPLAPATTNIDLIGLDPFPCRTDGTVAPDEPPAEEPAEEEPTEGEPTEEEAPPAEAAAPAGTCDLAGIDAVVAAATTAGIPADAIVPVFQAFGSGCATNPGWTLPTEDQLRQILAQWATQAPSPKLEVTYAWGNLAGWTCPTLADADGTGEHPDLQSVMREHNTGAAAPTDPSTTTAPPADETTTTAPAGGGAPTTTAPADPPADGGGTAAGEFYPDPNGTAAVWVGENGDDPRADTIRTGIAEMPGAGWFGGSDNVGAEVSGYVEAAAAAGQVPIMVAYNIPGRDCGLYSAGGAGSPEEYTAWVTEFAQGLGDSRAVVVLEPDALAQMLTCGMDEGAKADRVEILNAATEAFKANAPNAYVYLDAGNAGWIDPGEMAGALADVGVANIRGFAVNVANYKTTEASTDYGDAVNAALPAPGHYVIDTSRNGNGPVDGGEWCNPRGAKTGEPSQWVNAGGLDAYVWIKNVGDSDGECTHAGRNDPAAGAFDPDFAYGLVTGQW